MPAVLIMVVLAMLLGNLIYAGSSYINPSSITKMRTERVLSVQYAALTSAIDAYRAENNGIKPKSLSEVEGYLPRDTIDGFGKLNSGLTWSIMPEKLTICLTLNKRVESQDLDGAHSGFAQFVSSAIQSNNGSVTLARDCYGEPINVQSGQVQLAITSKDTPSISLRISRS